MIILDFDNCEPCDSYEKDLNKKRAVQLDSQELYLTKTLMVITRSLYDRNVTI